MVSRDAIVLGAGIVGTSIALHLAKRGLGESLEIDIDGRDHQVDVERLLRVRPQRFHHAGADGDVGDEMPVHHVDVDEIGTRGLDRLDLRTQPREISR